MTHKVKLVSVILALLIATYLYSLYKVPHQLAYEISRDQYQQKLQGFWLGQNIGNWTGLITEMDKVGTESTMPFYTDDDWGTRDLKAMWGEYVPHANYIDFYFQPQETPWGADDDTDGDTDEDTDDDTADGGRGNMYPIKAPGSRTLSGHECASYKST